MEIFVNKEGRLGNNLFQYFFAKILSKETNSKFYTSFDLPSEFGLSYEKFNTPPNESCNLKEVWSGPNVSLNLNSKKIEENLEIIIENLKLIDCKNLSVAGYFQQHNYYIKHREFIRESFNYNFEKKENILGIHVRKGDIDGTDNDLPDSWFIDMVKKFPYHKKYVTTDSVQSEVVKKLQDLGCELYQNSPQKTILEFSNFSDLILSQGTFSWWMAFLSDGNKNFFIPKKGWNSENSSTNLLPELENWNYYKLLENKLEQI